MSVPRSILTPLVAVLTLLLFVTDASAQVPIGTSFNYHGSLSLNGVPVNDSCDFEFDLFDVLSGGTPIGATSENGVTVSDGLFTAQLEFGLGAFNSDARWLEISARCPSGVGSFSILSPRNELKPTPFAIHTSSADNVPWSGVNSVPPGLADGVDNDTLGSLSSCSNGQIAKWDGEAWDCAADDTSAGGGGWSLTGNANTTAGTNFLGTTDDQPLELHVNGIRALRIEPDPTPSAFGPNWIGGDAANRVAPGVQAATISGGGGGVVSNVVDGDFGTIGGGLSNLAGVSSTVGGGDQNIADGDAATVGGGSSNTASGINTTVGGGDQNTASSITATVGGGNRNTAAGANSTAAGGQLNAASGFAATVGGGQNNTASGTNATVGGGAQNAASNVGDTVGGGELNDAIGIHSTVGGGVTNSANGQNAAVGGGETNTASADNSTVGGGRFNTAGGFGSTVSGGQINTASGQESTVAGGSGNFASGSFATIGGGDENIASGLLATVGGGSDNVASADFATIAGGSRTNLIDSGTANRVTDNYGTVGGGGNNQAGNALAPLDDATFATVSGGNTNAARGTGSTVGGGQFSVAAARDATVSGGVNNFASGEFSTIGGGGGNSASRQGATVGGGETNDTSGFHSTIGGGITNIASGDRSTVSGGSTNNARLFNDTIGGGIGNSTGGGGNSTVGGGFSNTADGGSVTIGGGSSNNASGDSSTIGGGGANTASGTSSTVVGGSFNTASGDSSTVGGGSGNAAAGDYSFAAGRAANVAPAHNGSFLFADSSPTGNPEVGFIFNSVAANEFAVRSTGGARFVSAIDGNGNPRAGVQLAPGGGSWSNLSDRNLKANFATVDGSEVLDKLSQIPLETWNYNSQDPSIRHIGPMSQDFYAAFGLGEDDKHISTIDADGVALAAIQGLYRSLQEKDAQITDLEARVARLEQVSGVNTTSAGLLSTGQPVIWLLLGGTLLGTAILGRRWYVGMRP